MYHFSIPNPMHVLLLENGYMYEVCIQWLNCIVLCAVKCVLNTTLDYKQPIRLDRITHAKHLNLKLGIFEQPSFMYTHWLSSLHVCYSNTRNWSQILTACRSDIILLHIVTPPALCTQEKEIATNTHSEWWTTLTGHYSKPLLSIFNVYFLISRKNTVYRGFKIKLKPYLFFYYRVGR